MADSTIKSIYLVLNDSMTGYLGIDQSTPDDGFTGTSHHNVAAAVYPVGTRKAVYISSLQGYSILTYLQNGVASGVAVAAGQVMIPDDVSNNANYYPTKITDDPDEGLLASACAIAISAMTNDYYGWFWTGGVCPVGIGSMTAATTTATDDSVTVGCTLMTCDLTADKAGLKIGAAAGHVVGFSMKADG